MSSTSSLAEIVRGLEDILGRKLTAYLAGVRDPEILDLLASGIPTSSDENERLRRAYDVAALLARRDDSAVIQAWFTGLNPELDDRAPIRLLAEGSDAEARAVLDAARLFYGGG